MTSFVTHVYLCLNIAVLCNAISVRFDSHNSHNVTLDCDDTLLNLPQYTTYKKYWILPDESILQPEHEADAKYIVGPSPGFNLTISYLVDGDSGWYRCVILWDNYIFLVHAIDVGLNVKDDDDFLEKYKQEIMYGGMALGGFFLILLIGCTSKYCCGKVKDDYDEDDIDDEELAEREAIAKLDRAVRSFDDSSTIGRHAMNRYRRRGEYVRNGHGNGYGNSVSSVASKRILVERRRSERDDTMPPGYRTSGDEGMCFQNEAFVLENGAIIPFAPSDTDSLDRFPDNYSESSESDTKPPVSY